MPNQHQISVFAELDWGGGYSGKKKLRGWNSNRKFYMGENRK